MLIEPTSGGVLVNAGAWLTGTLLGTAAITLCTLAVAFVGLQMLTGRLDVRRGLRVVLGCFVLLGAPVIANGLLAGAQAVGGTAPEPKSLDITVPEPPPPAHYDPYAGASLRRD